MNGSTLYVAVFSVAALSCVGPGLAAQNVEA